METTETKEKTMADGQKPPQKPNKPSYLPAPIEEVNASIAEAWEQLGKFQQIKIQKATLLKMANMQEMPLIGIDVIPTKQGLRLYINGEGAKFNRERYLAQNGRQMIGRTIDVVPYEQMPAAIPERDKAQGRVYYRITTTIEDVEQKAKIVDAVAKGIIKALEVPELLEKLNIVTRYQTYSSYSNQSEPYAENRQPDHILKKGITQSNRRADLEISSQCVVPEDEEMVDAEFSVKASSALADATKAAQEAATLPEKVLVPETPAPAAQQKPGPGGEGKPDDPAVVAQLITEVNQILTKANLGKQQRIDWFKAKGLPVERSKMTADVLKKAIEMAKKEFQPAAPEAHKAQPIQPAVEVTPIDPAKNEFLKKVFGMAEKAGFTKEGVQEWTRKTFGKGMSDMDSTEVETKVLSRIKEYVDFSSKYQKYGFASEGEFRSYASDFHGGKVFHDLSLDDLKKVEDQLGGMI